MTEVLRVAGASLQRGDNLVLREVDWTVNAGERWVVLGPNGAGKTTLLTLVSARLNASSGTVAILGETVGDSNVLELRSRVGLSSDALAARIASEELVRDVVLTAAHGTTSRQQEPYEHADLERAGDLLAAFGIQDFAAREFGTLSEGERKRVQLARSLMTDPELLLLDEPGAGLDLAGREELIEALTELAGDPEAPVMILVTHHVEEIPRGFTHALLMRDGAVAAAGPLVEVLNERNLAAIYGVSLTLDHSDGRWTARKARKP